MADMGPPREPQTVLVVEDEAPVRDLIREVLHLHGYHVVEAQDGGEAIRRAEHHRGPIDLVILDVMIPGVTALEVVRRLRDARPAVRVLYISGYTDDLIGEHGLLQVGREFLQKPFSLDALTRKVREVLDAT